MALPDLYSQWTQARQNGAQRANDYTVRQNIGGALQGDSGALSAILKASPDTGMKLQSHVQGQQKSQREDGIRLARGYLQTRDPGIARALLPHLKQLHPELPDNALELPGADEGIMKAAQALASLGDQQGQEQFTLAPGSKRFGPDGRVIAEVPFAPQRPDFQLYDSADGPVWLPKPSAGGMPQQGPMGGAGGAMMGGALRDAVEQQESGGNPNAVSPAGAMGRMQTMPGTLTDPGFGVSPARDRSDAEMTRVGNEYLQAMVGKYGTVGGLAAYNWGPGNWEAALQQSGGDPQRALQMAPKETQDYVPKVLGRTQGGQGAGAIPISGVRPKARADGAPSAYRFKADGVTLEPIPGGPADRKNNPTASDQAKGEMSMRKELEDRTKQSRIVLDMFRKVDTASRNASAPNDLALIFAYMKMLDPGSVVREQEFANAQNAAGVPDRIKNVYNKALKGERLNAAQRLEFLSSARQIATIAQDSLTSETRNYQGIADQYGYDPMRSTGAPDFRNANSGQPAGGDVSGMSDDDLLRALGQ